MLRSLVAIAIMQLLHGCSNDDSAHADASQDGSAPEQQTKTCSELEGQPIWANALSSADGGASSLAETRFGGLTGVVRDISEPSTTRYGLGDAPRSTAYALHVEMASQSVEVALSLPWRTPISQLGDTLHVSYAFRSDNGFPSSIRTGSIEVRDDEDRLLAWVFDGGPDELSAPAELEVEEIDGCTYECERVGCKGPIVLRGVRVSDGDDSVDVGFGEAADVGDFVFLHGGDSDDTGVALTGCADCITRHRIVFAVVRGSQESLAARDLSDDDAGF